MKSSQGKYNFIDLFAGCGGLTEGFLQSGKFNALAHVEWELPMVNTLRNRLVTSWGKTIEEAEREVICFDIQKTEELLWGEWSNESIYKYGLNNHSDVPKCGLKGIVGNKQVDLIIGGPPCQAYSIHGRATDKNSMHDDYRNFLFESFVKVVQAFQPTMFVFENVLGILSAKPGGVNITNRIFEAFDSIGYEIQKPDSLLDAVFDVSDYQVPQNRKRVIILGVKKGGGLNLNELYRSIREEKSVLSKRTVRDAIGWLPPIFPLKESIKKGRGTISHTTPKESPNISQHTPRFQGMREVNAFRQWIIGSMNNASQAEKIAFYFRITGHKTLYAKYKNLEWDTQAHTIVAHLSKDGYMFIHPDPNQARSITIREAALLMSFPQDYQFMGSSPYCFKMIGNAVPPLFAKSLAVAISKNLVYECISSM